MGRYMGGGHVLKSNFRVGGGGSGQVHGGGHVLKSIISFFLLLLFSVDILAIRTQTLLVLLFPLPVW